MVSSVEVMNDSKPTPAAAAADGDDGHGAIGSTAAARSSRNELLNLVSQIKSRVQDKLSNINYKGAYVKLGGGG